METSTLTFNQISLRIIQEQEAIIGPLAWIEAAKVEGLLVVQEKQEVLIKGDPKAVIDRLVARFVQLFGKLSKEVCREAVGDLIAEIPPSEVPESLK